MKIFGWRLACEHYGGPLFQWVPTHEQAEMFPEEVSPGQQVEEGRNLLHVSEYLPLGERDSDPTFSADLPSLPWDDDG